MMTSSSRLGWLLAGGILFLSFGYTEMQGSDLWWHLAAGREILQTGTLWMVDDWSFTAAGHTWRNHEWLADIVYYGWASLWSVESLVYWKWLLVLLTFCTLQYVLRRETESNIAAFLCASFAVIVAAPFIDVRPHLYSLLLFVVLLLALLNRRTRTWKLALLFVLWANLHGGFFFGLMALGILLFPWRNLELDAIKGAVGIGLICLVACLLNPSGLQSLYFPLTYAFDAESPFRSLGEWLSPFRKGGIQSPYFFWMLYAAPVVALAYLIPAVRRSVGVPWEGLVLSGLTLAMAVTSRRFIPLFAISFAVMSAPLVAFGLQKLKDQRLQLGLGLVAVLLAVLKLAPYPLAAGPAYHYLTAEYSYPIDTLDFMQANKMKGNVYALYNWGGYIHWRTDGALKVFIDGRADTIYDDRTYLDYVGLLTSRPGWISQLEQSQADYFLWPLLSYGGGNRGDELIKTGNWRLIHQDSVSFLLERTTARQPRKYQAGPDTAYRNLAQAVISVSKGKHAEAIAFANRTRSEIPYQKGACNLLFESHTSLGDKASADEVSRQCRGYFPSPLLRR
ncbi:MAG: hypothetical protein V7754_10025 [Halioglobus sp.]